MGAAAIVSLGVPLQNHRTMPDLGFHEISYAARWYSLITPPSTFRR
jgi:hypothetical protein